MASSRPTLRTVAEAAGVSLMTASNAYNRPDQLSAATRERVLAVATGLGYAGPSPAGRSLRRGRSDTIGVLLTERLPYAFADPGLLAFLHGLATGLAEAGQALLLIPTGPGPAEAIVSTAIVDGLVLCSLSPDDPSVAAAMARGIPVVTANSPRLPGVPFVGIDNAQAAVAAARHLLDLGHTRLAVVTVPGGRYAAGIPARIGVRDRVPGFLQAVAAAGLDPASVAVVEARDISRDAGADAVAGLLARPPGRRPTAVFAVTDVLALGVLDEARDISRDAGADAVAGLLARPPGRRPTAVFAVTDVLALGVLDAARAAGLAVPGQLSVVGFDDIAEAARTNPPLSTVAQPLFEKGRVTARMMLAAVAGKAARPPRISTHLVVRGTTAPPRGPRGTPA